AKWSRAPRSIRSIVRIPAQSVQHYAAYRRKAAALSSASSNGHHPTKEIAMDMRKLGKTGPEVSAIGLGAMGMSGMYGPADRGESLATVHAALDAGINLIDTGDFYGMGHNEMLLGEALKGVPRDSYVLSVKFGAQRGPDGAFLGFDGRPAAVKTAIAYSLQRLGVDHIDVYGPARLDPSGPLEDDVGA